MKGTERDLCKVRVPGWPPAEAHPPHSYIGPETEESSYSRRTEAALFFRAWLRAPLRIASMVPSSNATGRAFAQAVGFEREGDVLELGSGTGAISQALLDAGVPATRLLMIEREPELVEHLRRRFPGLRVVEGDATRTGPILDELGVRRLAAVVSTLPIVWFPLQAQAAVIHPCLDRLAQGGGFLQMTNQPASPLPIIRLGIAGARAASIWRNLPPSFIWRYWRPEAPANGA